MKKIYLPGLNGIRAIAAFLKVVSGHFAPFFALQIEIGFSFSIYVVIQQAVRL